MGLISGHNFLTSFLGVTTFGGRGGGARLLEVYSKTIKGQSRLYSCHLPVQDKRGKSFPINIFSYNNKRLPVSISEFKGWNNLLNGRDLFLAKENQTVLVLNFLS